MLSQHQDVLLALPSDLSIRTARLLQVEMLEHLRNHPETTIGLPDEYVVDLLFIQLVEPARQFADQNGRQFSLSRAAEGALLDVLERGGLGGAMTAQDRQFWFHQGQAQ